MSEWRPIESAPKNTPVLVWVEWPGPRGVSQGAPSIARLTHSGWLPDDDGAGFAYEPTHWMPLPAPPTPTSDGGETSE